MSTITKEKKVYDIAIVGCGINGCGIALDASLRGLNVLLIDKGDIGNYTSSASTKLIHGGLRYLEYLEFPLVRESLRERERLLKNAPHLIRPLKLNIPIYNNAKRNPLLIKMGMILYDVLSFDKSLPNHSMLFSKKKIRNYEPGLKHEKLKGVASYYDCIVDFPERLCMEIALSAKEEGADILTYTRVTEIKKENDLFTVQTENLDNNQEINFNAKYVINATGPFVDLTNQLAFKDPKKKMGGTKGSHIIIEKFEGGPKEALYIEAHQDGRPFFIIPWLDYYLVGTTDEFYEGEFDKVRMEESEINYLLKELNYYISAKIIKKEDIVFTYSGVRPLPFEPGKKEKQVTRKHIIFDHSKEDKIENYFSIIGGKLTTYRNLAEETIDIICKKEKILKKSSTIHYPLVGARGMKDFKEIELNEVVALSEEYGVSAKIAKHLIEYYGANARIVLDLCKNDEKLKNIISEKSLDIKAQIVYAIKYEFAKTLEDILVRRTSIGYSKDLGLENLNDIADIAALYLKWDEYKKKKEISNYIDRVVYYYQPNTVNINSFVTAKEENVII